MLAIIGATCYIGNYKIYYFGAEVIRLLDDVEGAARGDLTVQAEVTADVLGTVADAFNLTIQNLRDIVQQVKVAAKEVTLMRHKFSDYC
ncbi:hypothetical protein RIVM261_076010 [Rivularia sp. IAM M-261]|nr:hypothetical protein RIVM261_076010 [Rivularia sp. IAM M-261]